MRDLTYRGSVIDRTTGGSSGRPVRFLQARTYLDAASGRGMRQLAWSGWWPGARTAYVWGGPTELREVGSFKARLKEVVTNRRLLDAFRTDDATHDRWLADLRRWKPQFMIGYASALATLARRALEIDAGVGPLRTVFSTAERLHPDQRRAIEAAFGAPVRDVYGSREVQAIAAECTHGRMHAYLDSAVLDLGPADGGARRVLLTQLDNPVMPLIRYENGDLASWADDLGAPCECGLHYPALAGIHGRITDLFRFPGGRVVHGEYFTHIIYGLTGLKAFQFRQDPAGRLTLRVVPDGGSAVEPLLAVLRERVANLAIDLGTTLDCAIRVVDEIPTVGEGKFRFTISEYAP